MINRFSGAIAIAIIVSILYMAIILFYVDFDIINLQQKRIVFHGYCFLMGICASSFYIFNRTNKNN